ncbi:bifunctional polysaccharide deacetylase/glycosyltransferase family 2 protein [Streptomyces luteolifulvus]|uniref:bifunctional polysaccharide deacetylase/glycosyltransferase family 2 protein n=1 Tax=Streptomyces luteolifulvus TaxID=2615112 RepID=UPI001CD9C531|nr:bifunctional polysaccharide deacetylase/glycosyltransferase family 2 protein [Streptomyces luteolifulvus]
MSPRPRANRPAGQARTARTTPAPRSSGGPHGFVTARGSRTAEPPQSSHGARDFRTPPPSRPAPNRRARRRDPRAHWLLLLLTLAVAATALLFGGYGRHEIAPTAASARECATAPEAVRTGGPVLTESDGRLRSAHLPARTVALTYDGGPDPSWTPRLLDVLAAHHAKATFFLTGTEIAAHPGLVRRIRDEGHQIGSHTYTDADLAQTGTWRARLELALTQNTLAGAAGLGTHLLRLPHTASVGTLCAAEWSAGRRAVDAGYVLVAADAPGRSLKRGAVRQYTGSPAAVTETERLLAHPPVKGLHFTTVGAGLGMNGVTYPVDGGNEAKGRAVVWAQAFSRAFADGMTWLMAAAGVITVARLVLLFAVARVHVRRTRRQRRRGNRLPPVTDPVTVIVPAYNEEAGIEATLRSLLASTHEYVQIIVVDDGSNDRTFEIAESVRAKDARVMVIRQPNAGKAAALNTGLSWAHFDIVVMIDGDTVFDRDAIRRLIQPLADPRVGAVSGNTKVGNRQGILGRWQHLEYVIGFNLDRRMYDVLECMPTVPGAIGAFRRQALADVGGVSEDTLAEDTDLTMALCRAGWRVVYEESAIAWTEAPSTVRQLWKQRYRWCYGTLQAMWKHRRALVERGAGGKFGRRGLTYLTVFQMLLPLLAPLVDVFAVYGLCFQSAARAGAVWLGFTAIQVVCAVFALRLDKERFEPLWTLPLQIVVYRQLMYLVVVQSVVTALLGSRLRWHRMQRTGTAMDTLLRQPT